MELANVKVEMRVSDESSSEEEEIDEEVNENDVVNSQEIDDEDPNNDSKNDDISRNNSCVHCGTEVSSKQDLISHISLSPACLGHYGDKGLEKLKDEGNKVIDAKYQIDENMACAPVIEEKCSKLGVWSFVHEHIHLM